MADQQPRGRNSEGVVYTRHPRSQDQPEQGWLRAVALARYSWYTDQREDRTRLNPQLPGRDGRPRLFYTDFPQQGWIRKPTGTLYEAVRGYAWFDEGTHRHPRTNEVLLTSPQDVSWVAPAQGFDPAQQDWHLSSDRYTERTYWTAGPADQGWISGYLASIVEQVIQIQQIVSDPYTGRRYWTSTRQPSNWLEELSLPQAWGIPSERPSRRTYWTSDPEPQPWVDEFPIPQSWEIPSDPQHPRKYWTADPISQGWLGEPAAPPFDPSGQSWVTKSERTPDRASRTRSLGDWDQDVAWVAPLLAQAGGGDSCGGATVRKRISEGVSVRYFPRTDFPQIGWFVHPAFDVASQQDWQIPSERHPRRKYRTADPIQQGWLGPPVAPPVFDPSTQPWTTESGTYATRRYRTADPLELAWLARFRAPNAYPIPSERVTRLEAGTGDEVSGSLGWSDVSTPPPPPETAGGSVGGYVQKRISEGVVELPFPRTDFPSFGWLGSQQQAIFNPALYDWSIPDTRMGGQVYDRRTYATLDWPELLQTPQAWPIQSTDLYKKAAYWWTVTPAQQGWLPVFDPATECWTIESPRMGHGPAPAFNTQPRPDWLLRTDIFDAAADSWIIQSDPVAHAPWWTDGTPNQPIITPRPDQWTIVSDAYPDVRRMVVTDFQSAYTYFANIPVFDPRLFPRASMDRSAKRSQRSPQYQVGGHPVGWWPDTTTPTVTGSIWRPVWRPRRR